MLTALRVTAALLIPLVAVYVLVGATPGMGLAMGYMGSLVPALKVPRLRALALTAPVAMTGAVATAVNGQAFVVACFLALVCLLVAPANVFSNGLLAAVPTVAAVIATLPSRVDPFELSGWMVAGGVLVVLLMSPLRKPGDQVGLDVNSAWTHAIAMGAAVGVSALLVTAFEVPHGYWICMTLTLVLRPYGAETLSVARQRVLGTIGGAVLALGLAVVLPDWAALSVLGLLLVLTVAYSTLGRSGQQVVFLTPVVVLLGSGGAGAATVTVAVERVLATILGALIAAVLALALARADRARPREPVNEREPGTPPVDRE